MPVFKVKIGLDVNLLKEVKANYGKMSATALMKHTYVNFPFYATRSEAATNILIKGEFLPNNVPDLRRGLLMNTNHSLWLHISSNPDRKR